MTVADDRREGLDLVLRALGDEVEASPFPGLAAAGGWTPALAIAHAEIRDAHPGAETGAAYGTALVAAALAPGLSRRHVHNWISEAARGDLDERVRAGEGDVVGLRRRLQEAITLGINLRGLDAATMAAAAVWLAEQPGHRRRDGEAACALSLAIATLVWAGARPAAAFELLDRDLEGAAAGRVWAAAVAGARLGRGELLAAAPATTRVGRRLHAEEGP